MNDPIESQPLGVDEIASASAALAAACRRLHSRGLLAGAEGNLSIRLRSGELLVTASGVDKGAMTSHDVLRLRADGTMRRRDTTGEPAGEVRKDGAMVENGRRPSSELAMHLACYAARADVRAVVHAHPPVATGFATAGRAIPDNVLPEVPVVVGPIALVPYGRPGTPALSQAMAPFLAGHEAFLLANHGVTAVGRTLEEALSRLESVEQAARIVFVADLLGGARPLEPGEVSALRALRPSVGS